ncbi:MAG TPA: glycosyltransferase family 4 protein, partial [Cryomorphaceae bacterium]|nr:glycosyltransferase family 4 protein [Cryomorphaceae bacterium]
FFKDIPFIRLAAKSRIKVLIQLRGSAFKIWFDSLDNFRKKLVARHISMSDGAIVLGESLKYLFADYFDDHQIFSVPNGGDFEFPVRQSQTLRVVYLANFLPGKGLLEVLQALEKVKDEPSIPAFEFVAYGAWDNSDYQSKCERIAAKLNFVELKPSVSGSAKWQAFADADIFVFAPKSPEGHPWSIVEAIAAGLPVVSTNRGAIAQSVRDGQNGFLLENPDPGPLAEKIQMLLRDPSLREKMGRESRRLYENHFTASAMTEKLSGVFEKILAEKCAE